MRADLHQLDVFALLIPNEKKKRVNRGDINAREKETRHQANGAEQK